MFDWNKFATTQFQYFINELELSKYNSDYYYVLLLFSRFFQPSKFENTFLEFFDRLKNLKFFSDSPSLIRDEFPCKSTAECEKNFRRNSQCKDDVCVCPLNGQLKECPLDEVVDKGGQARSHSGKINF